LVNLKLTKLYGIESKSMMLAVDNCEGTGASLILSKKVTVQPEQNNIHNHFYKDSRSKFLCLALFNCRLLNIYQLKFGMLNIYQKRIYTINETHSILTSEIFYLSDVLIYIFGKSGCEIISRLSSRLV